MKKNFILIGMIISSMGAMSQESMITLSGGYSFANIEDSQDKGTGWRINGSYEFNPTGGMLVHGISLGYISLSATDGTGQQTIDTKINSFPIYYAPKLWFGSDKFKAFAKGALGMQFTTFKREGYISLSDEDFGFYGGVGAGTMIFLNENIFLNLEYEIDWVSNSFYKDGWINTAMAGIGYRF